MRKFSTNISALAVGAVLSTSLVLGGCGDKNKGKSASSEVKLEKIAPRSVDEAQATKALTALSLNNSGSGIFSWGGKTGSAGNYTYTDVVISDDDDDEKINVAKLELTGAHMVGDQVAFDKIAFNTLSVIDDETTVGIDRIELLKPSTALSNELARAFSGDEDAFEDVEGDLSIGGLRLAGLDVKDDDADLTLESMMFGEAKDKTGVFSMKALKMDVKENENINISLGSIDITGMNIEKYKGLFSESMKNNDGDAGEEAMKKIMSSLNPYAPDYKNFSVRDFDLNANGLTVDVDFVEANSSVKNGKTTITQSTSPIIITPPAQPTDRGMIEFADAMTELGYEQLVFSSSQKSVLDEANDSMKVSDSYIELKDGFKLSYDYNVTGTKAMMEKAGIMGVTGSGANPAAAMEMMGEMKFSKLRLALQDNSIIDRGFKLAASQQGGTPEALKLQAKAMLGFLPMAAKTPGQQKVASDLVNALGTLLENGGTLVVEMNPETPVDLAALSKAQDADFDIAKLGLTIRTD